MKNKDTRNAPNTHTHTVCLCVFLPLLLTISRVYAVIKILLAYLRFSSPVVVIYCSVPLDYFLMFTKQKKFYLGKKKENHHTQKIHFEGSRCGSSGREPAYQA
jgi:hypothetical protein